MHAFEVAIELGSIEHERRGFEFVQPHNDRQPTTEFLIMSAILKLPLAILLYLLAALAVAQSKPSGVQFIATGGTIAMKIDPVKNAPVPAISGDDLLATVPDIASTRKSRWTTSPMCRPTNGPRPLGAAHDAVQAALSRPEVAGVIVSHGTDTLEETAFWLDLTVNLREPSY